MDEELRIRLVGLGLQLTLVGGFVSFAYGEVGVALGIVGTVVTGWGVV